MNDIFIILAIPFAISFVLSLLITQKMRIISYNGYLYLRQNKDDILGMEMGGLSVPYHAYLHVHYDGIAACTEHGRVTPASRTHHHAYSADYRWRGLPVYYGRER